MPPGPVPPGTLLAAGTAALAGPELTERLAATGVPAHDLDQAARLIVTALPEQLPSPPGLDVAALSVPARRVGGDFLDVVEVGGCCALCLGDIAGKGLPAAVAMTATSVVARAKLLRHAPRSLPEAAAEVNADLYDFLVRIGRFATAAFAVHHAGTDELQVVSLGHGLVFSLAQSGVQLVPPGGPPLGLLPELRAEQVALPFRPGDAVVLVSDGVIDQRDPAGASFGLARLTDLLSRLRGRSAQGCVDAVLGEVRLFADGEPMEDDLSVLVVVREG